MSEDELIQKQIEEGNVSSGIDADAYRMVFHALKKEPTAKLSEEFAQRIASIAFTPKKSFDWDKFFLGSGLFALIIALIYAIVVTQFTFSFGSFQFLNNYSFFFVFAIIVIAGLQWLDKKILKTIHH